MTANVSTAPVAPVTTAIPKAPQAPLAFLAFFIFVELYYAASLFSGLSVGGSGYAPLSRFYPSASGPSDLFANDMHAFSILWFTIPLMPLAYLNRNDPAKIVRLLHTIGFVLLTMTGLLIGMKEKLGEPETDVALPKFYSNFTLVLTTASNEFSFAIYLNIALLILLNVASKNIVPSKRDTTATPTRNATLFNALICISYFFATTLGRPDKFCKEKTYGTSGGAWISADLLFYALVSVFTFLYGNAADNIAHSKTNVLLSVLAEIYVRFWSYEHSASINESSFVHLITILINLYALMKSKTESTTSNTTSNDNIKLNPKIPIVLTIVSGLTLAFKYLAGGHDMVDFSLTPAEEYQHRLQGLSILWSLIPFIGIAYHARNDLSRLSSLSLTSQRLWFIALGVILTLGKSSTNGLIRDDLYNFGVVSNIVQIALASLGAKHTPHERRRNPSEPSAPEKAFYLIIAFNVFYYLKTVFDDGAAFNSQSVNPDRTGASKWLAMNIFSVTVVFGGVLTYGHDFEALFLTKVFMVVVALSEVFNQTVAKDFMPEEAMREVAVVHAVMFGAMVAANKDFREKLKVF
ncbi:hypothetical protein TL16_g13007 [Triparma laevis f. inornata]|uniref:Uncharacterized protein n=1 Tax=Triparma laevis f. inornata TaxID=1714386 RepID=A0A9W7BW91_9STRA|nr:hypothetical protein TL16_g13007 [Triparma laevis f. inornata]